MKILREEGREIVVEVDGRESRIPAGMFLTRTTDEMEELIRSVRKMTVEDYRQIFDYVMTHDVMGAGIERRSGSDSRLSGGDQA